MEHSYSHPHAAKSGDGDARDDTDLDAFERANVNTATRSANEYTAANTGNANSGMYG